MMSMATPGHLLHHEEIATSLTGAKAFRIRYVSKASTTW